MKTYSIDIVKVPKDWGGALSEAVVDSETGSTAFIVGEDQEFAKRLVEFMNRFELIKDKGEATLLKRFLLQCAQLVH
jgi:hypothetical protein